MNAQDEKYMQVALRLGRRGIGSVEPNPAVGCIIVKGNQIVGRAWHRKFGGPHAEISALEDTNNLGVDPQGSAMYVTLEPCCHHGKTPPCTDAIIRAGCARVVVAAVDPSGHAQGKGIVNRLTGRYDTGSMETWQQLSVAFETTGDTRGASLAIEKGTGLARATVKLWLDDVRLELLESP